MIITKLSTRVDNFVDNFIFFYLKGCFKMQIEKDELLNQAKELLKEEVTQIAYETWFSPMVITEITGMQPLPMCLRRKVPAYTLLSHDDIILHHN